MDPAALLQPYLRSDESLLWSGKPDPRVWFTASDRSAIPFSLLWGGFAIFWEASALQGGGRLLIPQLFGLPFVAMGAYMIFGRFIVKHVRKKRTVYGITTKRAVVVDRRGLTDMPLRDRAISIQRSRDSRHASVVIGDQGRTRYANSGLEFLERSGQVPYGLWDVADPEGMLAALDQARSLPPAART